jgi:hypothetical protein
MTSFLRVNGYANVLIGPQDRLALADMPELGWTVDGVEISEQMYTEDVYTDRLGGHIPEDVQNFGAEARITLDLIKYDLSVLRKIITREYNGTVGVTPNLPAEAGDLMNACEKFFACYINRQYGDTNGDCRNPGSLATAINYSSGTPEGNWYFPRCYVVDERSVKVGTKVTRHRLTLRALPNATGMLYTENCVLTT